MCSSFIGEEVGKGKAFTHKSQNVKRIEGRGEGKKRKVAECAMRGCVRKRECAYTRERAGRVCETGEQNGNEGRGRALKKRGFGGERRERKSASFRPLTTGFEIRELFVAIKVGFIERKCLPLQANKHNTSLSCRNAAHI
jgi:hypothetical protein